jgi:hypothetical protein
VGFADDETDADSRPIAARQAAPLGDKLGRYTIESPLGRGGVGVVYLAYDPDLERRVALKVLQAADEDSRARLLREARAMARLAHPSVVTVFDVGTVDGRDYVTMELMDAGTLADWLGKPRSARDIVRAFITVGRGLEAAHGAGLVHRDVKPANILRAADGRFALTDFGLARDHADTDSLRPRPPRSDVHVVPRPPSALPDVTATGAVLGTPQYMAPEQWTGDATPASDQFAYCTSMFEAFAGRRPFGVAGADSEALRIAVARGPSSIDARALRAVPRRLRAIIARGLETEPARRWPTMTALLAAIARAERRPRVIAAASSGVLGVSAVALLVAAWASNRRPPADAPVAAPPGCRAPRTALADVWRGPADASAIAARGPFYDGVAAAMSDDASAWQQVRDRVCASAPASQREPALACLDGALARFALMKDIALASAPDPVETDVLTQELVAPEVCAPAGGEPPRLLPAWSDTARTAMQAFIAQEPSRSAMVVKPFTFTPPPGTDDDPCAKTIALQIEAFDTQDYDVAKLDAASNRAALCGDDRVLADALLLRLHWTRELGAPRVELVARARRAESRVAQPDLDARLAILALPAAYGDDVVRDTTIGILARSRDAFARRHREAIALRTTAEWLMEMASRRSADDLATIERVAPPAVAACDALPDVADELRAALAIAQWTRGDLDRAHAVMRQIEATDTGDLPPGEAKATGRVVDEAGRPVANARVAASPIAIADASLIGVVVGPMFDPSIATTDARGEFALAVPPYTPVVAEAGGKRSAAAWIANSPTLVLRPTRALTGHVTFRGKRPFAPIVEAHGSEFADYLVAAAVGSDGSFTLAGVGDGPLDVAVADGPIGVTSEVVHVAAGRADVHGVDVDYATTARTLTVAVKSTIQVAVRGAFVDLTEAGRVVAAPRDLVRGHIYAHAVAEIGDHDDVVARFHGAPVGKLVACASARFLDVDRPDVEMAPDSSWGCVDVPADRDSVVIEVAPVAPPASPRR